MTGNAFETPRTANSEAARSWRRFGQIRRTRKVEYGRHGRRLRGASA